jgi:hypothetical protein
MRNGGPEADLEDLVTVVIPTKDRPSLLVRAVRSVLRQVDVAVDVVVVDDASSADMRSLAELGDSRVRVLRRDWSGGPAGARNDGVAAARGSWIAFLDDDDLWAPQYLSAQLAALRGTSAQFSWTSIAMIDGRGGLIRVYDAPPVETIVTKLYEECPIVTPSCVVVGADLLRRLGGFDERYAVLADWDCWIRVAREAVATSVPRPLVAYTVHEGGVHVTDREGVRSELGRLRQAYAVDAAAHGVAIDMQQFEAWLASARAAAGWRLGAAAAYGRLWLRSRDPKLLVQAAKLAVIPDRARSRVRHARARRGGRSGVEPFWLEENG